MAIIVWYFEKLHRTPCETMNNEQPSITHLTDKAPTYDEAMKRGKAVKRGAPQSKVEIIFDGIAAEIRAGRK